MEHQHLQKTLPDIQLDLYRRKAKEAQEEYVEWYESICNAIADFCESLYKDTDAIISENDDFFSALWDVNQVVCLGLSFRRLRSSSL